MCVCVCVKPVEEKPPQPHPPNSIGNTVTACDSRHQSAAAAAGDKDATAAEERECQDFSPSSVKNEVKSAERYSGEGESAAEVGT